MGIELLNLHETLTLSALRPSGVILKKLVQLRRGTSTFRLLIRGNRLVSVAGAPLLMEVKVKGLMNTG